MSRKTTAYVRRHKRTPSSKVAEAVLVTKILADTQELRTQAELQVFIGANCKEMLHKVGWLIYVVGFAADVHGLCQTPEARIIQGTANALGELAEQPASMERQRATLIAGLAAVERLMHMLSVEALVHGSMNLSAMLKSSKGAANVRAALMQGQAVA